MRYVGGKSRLARQLAEVCDDLPALIAALDSALSVTERKT